MLSIGWEKSIKQINTIDTMGEQNVFYNIHERCNVEVDMEALLEEVNADIDASLPSFDPTSQIESDILTARSLEFSTNYTVQGLGRIMDYYKLSKRRMKKDELVQTLVIFEDDICNGHIVDRRRRLWENMEELKEDPYFAKFISF